MKLSTKLVFLAVIAVLITASITLFISINESESAIEKILSDYSRNLAGNIINSVDRMLYERFENIRSWSSLEIMKTIEEPTGDIEGNLSVFLNNMKKAYPFFHLLMVARAGLDEDIVEASTDIEMLNKPVPEKFWFSADPTASFSTNIHIGDIQKFSDKIGPTVIFRAAIKNEENPLGVLIALIDPDFLSSIIPTSLKTLSENNREFSEPSVLIVNRKGNFITGYGPLSKQCVSGKNVSLLKNIRDESLKENNQKYMVFSAVSEGFQTYRGMEWVCYVFQPVEQIYLPSERLTNKLSWAGIILSTIIAVLIAFVIEKTFRPMGLMMKDMKRIAGGGEIYPVSETGQGEILELHNAYNNMLRGLEERDLVKSAFSRYVSGDLLDLMGEHGRLELGGVETDVTVMFMDIRNFTSASENLSPTELVSALNDYFTMIVSIIFKHQGTLDKFIGDCVMCEWGCPISHSEDTLRAVKAAVEIRDELVKFNIEREEIGKVVFSFGIGLSSGPVVAGNIGSPERLEYTVIGDTVNVAARIESLTKEHNCAILVSETCFEKISEKIEARFIDRVLLKGREERMGIYELIEIKK